MLLTPSGEPAGDMDRTMLLSLWTKQLVIEGKSKSYYRVGMGRPTYPLNADTAMFAAWYWLSLALRSAVATIGLSLLKYFPFFNPHDFVSLLSPAIDYGHPQGELLARRRMSLALNQWYGREVEINEKNILFTVGGAAGLHIIFNVINRKMPNGRILTQFPHYSLYRGSHGQNNLFAISVMDASGYKLNAAQLDSSIKRAYQLGEIDGGFPSAFLFCDPNNPLATALNKNELRAIAEILRKYPLLYIILDEAYAEMRLDGDRVSLLSVAPDLKNRIILMRSATKALSAAGERMAVTVAFDSKLMEELVAENIGICGHAPKSLQHAFAHAMEKLTPKKQRKLIDYYAPQMTFVGRRIKEMGAQMPDASYCAAGTFYALANLSDFIGSPINKECFRAIKRASVQEDGLALIETDEEIVYHLLFTYGIMAAPFSYFGISNKLGYIRITCSAGNRELHELMDKLEVALKAARAFKHGCLATTEVIVSANQKPSSLETLPHEKAKDLISVLNLHSFKNPHQELDFIEMWSVFVKESTSSQAVREYLLDFSIEQILSFKPFITYQREAGGVSGLSLSSVH
ncbi:MAG: pyridoxal phosphate-dependent aminotransferase [Gammaproteobacteria bacterium]|nr:pyridoxal phosphate-dependent aminotransferase [Gammaproteobacteria bacterium]